MADILIRVHNARPSDLAVRSGLPKLSQFFYQLEDSVEKDLNDIDYDDIEITEVESIR